MSRPLRSARAIAGIGLVLVLLGGCGGSAEEPISAGPSGASAPSESETPDAADAALADLESVAGTAATFDDTFVSYLDTVKKFILESDNAAAILAVQQQGPGYTAARDAYRDAAEGLDLGALSNAPEVEAAYQDYGTQVTATLDAHDASIAFYYSYGVCNQALKLSLVTVRSRAAHQTAADLCVQTVEPLSSSPYSGVASYAAAMTTLMSERKKVYDRVGGASLEELGRDGGVADQAKDDLVGAYNTFFPTLRDMTKGGGLQALIDATTVGGAYTALETAVTSQSGT